jgi:hypothetical protein|nr:MAG TPA: late control gene D protein [Caudoviricetes sp.]
MSGASRLPETCRVYLDLAVLPFQSDGTADLVALSPFTIEWGVSKPWDATTPNVLKITLLDQGDRFSKSADLLMGHRITVTPDWQNEDYTALNFCLFDGYVTDVQILDNDHGKNRLSVTASDRLYILKTDCRKGPTTGTDANMAKGWQWWMQGTTAATIKQWLKFDGINSNWMPYSTFAAPFPAADRKSFIDWADRLKTRKANNKYQFEVDRVFYIGYQNSDTEQIPAFEALYLRWTLETVLTGPRIRAGDDNTDITLDSRYPDAMRVIIDQDPTLSAADDYYTQLEAKFYHRGAASDGYKTYEFNQDGSSLAQIEQATRNGEACLSIDVDWTAYDSNADSQFSGVDKTLAINTVRESNRRIRLPEVTFRGDKLSQLFMYCHARVVTFIGSRFERRAPATHGAWAYIGGTLTYDVTGRKSHWTHKVKLFPAVSTATGAPTCADMKALKSAATFADCNWKLGALRYVTKTGDEPA